MSLTYGSLCSGYCGLDLGVQSVLGGETVWVSEVDPAASRILAHHYPNVPNLGDLTRINWHRVKRPDVITAGFPCQPFSHAGKRLGANDERHLWPHIAEAISILRPSLVVLENVRGLLSGQGEPDTPEIVALDCRATQLKAATHRAEQSRSPRVRSQIVRLTQRRRVVLAALKRARRRIIRAIGAVLRDLARIGYDARWYGFRAADVGAAHGRWRVFIFATPANAARGLMLLPSVEDDYLRDLPGRSAVTDLSVMACGGLLPMPRATRGGSSSETRDLLLPTPSADNSRGIPYGTTDYASLANSVVALLPTPEAKLGSSGPDYARADRDGSGGDDLTTTLFKLLPTPSVADGEGGHLTRSGSCSDELLLPGVAKAVGERMLLPTPRTTNNENLQGDGYGGPTGNFHGLIQGLVDWREYAPAISRHAAMLGRPAPAPTKTGAKGNQRLAPAFVEWLMCAPAGHVTDPAIGISDNDQLKALGNGVVIPQAAAATRAWVTDTAMEMAA